MLKVREEGRVRALMMATGINEAGYREILGIRLGDSESEAGWTELFVTLKQRGPQGVDFMVSDNHQGLVHALHAQFQGASWQRCQTHFVRNVWDVTPKAIKDEFHQQLRALLEAPDVSTARLLMNNLIATYADTAPKAVALLEDAFDDITAVLPLPERYRKRLRTTNSVERLNEEIRRRDRVIRIYPNRESAVRLIGAVLMRFNPQRLET